MSDMSTPAAEPAAERMYAGLTTAQRRSERRARLLDAAVDVLGTQGLEAATVTAVCRRARLIPRYFYESFSDRDELLVAVFDSIMDEVAVEVANRGADDGSVEAAIRMTIEGWLAV